MSTIAIVDYGMGNFHSVARALAHAAPDADIRICNQPGQIAAADRVVFPGQGAMADCMRTLNESGLREAVLRAAREKPLLGVCVGEQMLFDHSEEGDTPGLGIFPGTVRRFAGPQFAAGPPQGKLGPLGGQQAEGAAWGSPFSAPVADDGAACARDDGVSGPTRDAGAAEPLKVPHMGWNRVRQTRAHPVWSGIPDGAHFYFVHSYYAAPEDDRLIAGVSDYGLAFTCAVAAANIFAVQFHPEKSAEHGLRLYRNFVDWNP